MSSRRVSRVERGLLLRQSGSTRYSTSRLTEINWRGQILSSGRLSSSGSESEYSPFDSYEGPYKVFNLSVPTLTFVSLLFSGRVFVERDKESKRVVSSTRLRRKREE